MPCVFARPFKGFLTLFAERLCRRPADVCCLSAGHEILSVFFVSQMFPSASSSPRSLSHSFTSPPAHPAEPPRSPPAADVQAWLCSALTESFSDRFGHIFIVWTEKVWHMERQEIEPYVALSLFWASAAGFLIKYVKLQRRSRQLDGRKSSRSTDENILATKRDMHHLKMSGEMYGAVTALAFIHRIHSSYVTDSFDLHQYVKQLNRRRMWNFPALKWCDVSALVPKDVSVFVSDCVTAGMPLLQGLASCPFCYVCVGCTASSCQVL